MGEEERLQWENALGLARADDGAPRTAEARGRLRLQRLEAMRARAQREADDERRQLEDRRRARRDQLRQLGLEVRREMEEVLDAEAALPPVDAHAAVDLEDLAAMGLELEPMPLPEDALMIEDTRVEDTPP
jgi:hypothetical protein